MKTRKAFNIMKVYSRKLKAIEKNGAKPTNGQSNSKCKTNL